MNLEIIDNWVPVCNELLPESKSFKSSNVPVVLEASLNLEKSRLI